MLFKNIVVIEEYNVMAAKKGKSNPIDESIKELNDSLFASNYGLSRQFVDENEELVRSSNKMVADTLSSYGISSRTGDQNSLLDLSLTIQRSLSKSGKDHLTKELKHFDNEYGLKEISNVGNLNVAENEVINQNAQLFESFFAVASEYRGCVSMVPNVQRAIENIVRDVLFISELTKRYFNDIYNNNGKTSNETEINHFKRFNKMIQEEIIDRNNLEERFERWVFESLICGVKAVSFIPYDYIIKQIDKIYAKNKDIKLFDDINTVENIMKSGESFDFIPSDTDKRDAFYKMSIESSLVDAVPRKQYISPVAQAEEAYNAILDDRLVLDYIEAYESDFNLSFENIRSQKEIYEDNYNRSKFFGAEDASALALEAFKDAKESESKMRSKKDELDKMSRDSKIDNARQQLKLLAKYLDENIDVVKPEYSAAYIANKVFAEKNRYNGNGVFEKQYKNAEDFLKQRNSEKKNNDVYEFDSHSAFSKECLIIPYAAENVIPINVNGEYMGFYCLEVDSTSSQRSVSGRRKNGGFTDYLNIQGFGNDKNLIGGPNRGAGLANYSSMGDTLYSPMNMYTSVANGYFQDTMKDDRKFKIMKTIILRVLAHRFHDPDLIDNKIFKDAVMYMLRSDMLLKKRVQFTFVPPEYMLYMTYKVDDYGVPVSMLDGTLFDFYLLISSKISSGMIKLLKSSDKEKYEVDVGLQKNMGYTADELQRTLSTRSVYSQSMFGSLSSVIKNAGSYQRLIIPVVRDKKLYDVTQIERMNNLDPDDEYTDKLEKAILNRIYINTGTASEFDQADFARQITSKNIEYRNNIIKIQPRYERYAQKMLRLLTKYSKLPTYNSREDELKSQLDKLNKDGVYTGQDYKTLIMQQYSREASNTFVFNGQKNLNAIDLICIDPKFSAPTYLSMTNIIDTVDTAKNVANSLAEVYDLIGGNAVEDAIASIFKREIIKKQANILQWDDVEQLVEKAKREAEELVKEKIERQKIDEYLNNPPSEEEEETGEEEEPPEDDIIDEKDDMNGDGLDENPQPDENGGQDMTAMQQMGVQPMPEEQPVAPQGTAMQQMGAQPLVDPSVQQPQPAIQQMGVQQPQAPVQPTAMQQMGVQPMAGGDIESPGYNNMNLS